MSDKGKEEGKEINKGENKKGKEMEGRRWNGAK